MFGSVYKGNFHASLAKMRASLKEARKEAGKICFLSCFFIKTTKTLLLLSKEDVVTETVVLLSKEERRNFPKSDIKHHIIHSFNNLMMSCSLLPRDSTF